MCATSGIMRSNNHASAQSANDQVLMADRAGTVMTTAAMTVPAEATTTAVVVAEATTTAVVAAEATTTVVVAAEATTTAGAGTMIAVAAAMTTAVAVAEAAMTTAVAAVMTTAVVAEVLTTAGVAAASTIVGEATTADMVSPVSFVLPFSVADAPVLAQGLTVAVIVLVRSLLAGSRTAATSHRVVAIVTVVGIKTLARILERSCLTLNSRLSRQRQPVV